MVRNMSCWTEMFSCLFFPMGCPICRILHLHISLLNLISGLYSLPPTWFPGQRVNNYLLSFPCGDRSPGSPGVDLPSHRRPSVQWSVTQGRRSVTCSESPGDRSEGPVTAGHILGYHCEPLASSIFGLLGPGSEWILQCHLKLHARRGATILFRCNVEAPPMVSRLSLSFSVFGARAVVFTDGGFGSFLHLFIIEVKARKKLLRIGEP